MKSNYNNLFLARISNSSDYNFRIENLELQIKKSGLELQMLETDLRDYELGPEQEPSLHQLSWCDKNLNHSLQKVIHRKNALAAESSTSFEQSNEKMGQTESENQGGIPISSDFDENEQTPTIENPFTGQIMMQLDPWISPYNAKVEESMFHELYGQPNYTSNDKFGLSNSPNSSIPCNFPVLNSHNIFESENTLTPHAQITSSHFPIEQSLNVDQPLLDFHQQNNIDAWNNTSSVIIFSDAAHKSSQSSCNIQSPRSTCTATITTTTSRVEMPQSFYDDFQHSNSNSNSSHISTMEKHEIGKLNMSYCQNSFNNIGTTRFDNVDDEDRCRIIDSNETQLRASFFLHDIQKEVFQDTNYGNFLQEDTLEELEDIVSISEVQTSSLWEWDDLLLDGNINL
ncbi:hypothetical protein CASFOL_018562 [Castilleja foliolosa]|uniref:Uncharacterized protein n=1 Tax=Castilleja foliolosa TaxID=1961234 RepID=A0ABD3D6C8_9LAMI